MINSVLKVHDRIRRLHYVRLGAVILGVLFAVSHFAESPTWEFYMKQGLKAANRKQYKEAELAYSKALVLTERFVYDDDRLPETMYNLAVVYLHENRNADAGEIFKQLLTMRQRKYGINSVETTASLRNLAVHDVMNQKPAEAEALFKHALDIWQADKGKNHHNLFVSLNNLAAFYTMQKQYDKAQPLLIRSVQIASASNRTEDTCAAEKRLADNYVALNQLDLAVPILRRWAEYGDIALNYQAERCEALLIIAKFYIGAHRPQSAEPFLEKTIAVASSFRDPSACAKILLRVAAIYRETGNQTKANTLCATAKELMEQPSIVASPDPTSPPARSDAPVDNMFSAAPENNLRFAKYSI